MVFYFSYPKTSSNSVAQAAIFDANGHVKDSEIKELIREIDPNVHNHIYLVNQNTDVKELLQ